MKQAKTDRRARRTRQLLNTTLVELMREKRYNAITVRDILERANIGRSTFYTHFYDKDDLLLNDVAALIARRRPQAAHKHEPHAPLLPSLALFAHVDEQRVLYTALARGHMLEAVLGAVQAQLVAHIERTIAPLAQPADYAVPPAAVARPLRLLCHNALLSSLVRSGLLRLHARAPIARGAHPRTRHRR